jgi:hypothetical protein
MEYVSSDIDSTKTVVFNFECRRSKDGSTRKESKGFFRGKNVSFGSKATNFIILKMRTPKNPKVIHIEGE